MLKNVFRSLLFCALICIILTATTVIAEDNVEAKPMVRVTTLVENSNADHPELAAEHGLAMFIETEEGNILFDTGKSGNYIENAEKLGLDLKTTKYLILSHAHYDHCNGVKDFLEKVNPEDMTLCVSDQFFTFNEKYHYQAEPGPKMDFTDGNPGYTFIGINFDKAYLDEKGVQVELLEADEYQLTDQVAIFSNFAKSEKENRNPAMQVLIDGEYQIDEFKEEIALAIDTMEGIVILTGCSHSGIMNIVDTIHKKTGKNIYAVIGGNHLVEADEERIKGTIIHFKELGISMNGMSHCTGAKAVEIALEMTPEISFINSTGTVLTFN